MPPIQHENIQTENNETNDARQRITSRLHPRVYALLIGFALWLVLSVWLFAGNGIIDYLLFIISGFVFIAVALPLILSRVDRANGTAGRAEPRQSYRDWAALDFDTWSGRLSARQAAVQILLPVAAVAVGMTLFGLALHVAEHGATL